MAIKLQHKKTGAIISVTEVEAERILKVVTIGKKKVESKYQILGEDNQVDPGVSKSDFESLQVENENLKNDNDTLNQSLVTASEEYQKVLKVVSTYDIPELDELLGKKGTKDKTAK